MLLDAYTVRKAVPRIVIAVIGINLSIYLCIALIDITNVIGGGMAQLMTAPFNTAGLDSFSVDTDPTNSIVAGVGAAVAGPSIYAMLATFFTSLGAGAGVAAAAGGISVALAGLAALFFIIILPVLLLVLGILGVVVIRQALLLFLTIVSPVAIALFVLPGTEKYFKKWFDLFVKTLLVYPIIAVVFAISDIFGSIIFSNAGGGAMSVAKIITGLAVIYAPLFLIPFAFRLAGGAIAGIAKVAGGMGDRIGKSGLVKGRQEYYGQKFKDTQTKARAEAYRRAKSKESTYLGNGLRARTGRFMTGGRRSALAGYKNDIYAQEAEMTERYAKQWEQQKNFGDDTDGIAYGIDIKAARADMAAGAILETDKDGNRWRVSSSGLMRQKLNSKNEVEAEEFKSLSGHAWKTEADVKHATSRFGERNLTALQTFLAYDMTKATEEGQQEQLMARYGALTKSWGMSGSESTGTWIGPAFNNQQEDIMYKHTTFDDNGNAKVNYEGMTREIYEKKGPQMLAYLKGKNIKTLRDAHAHAIDEYNVALGSGDVSAIERASTQLKMHESIADTLSARGGAAVTAGAGAGAPGAPGAPAAGTPGATVTPTGGSSGSEYGYTTGAGHTTDELKQYFAEVQGVARDRSGTPNGRITNPHRNPGGTPTATESQAAEREPFTNPDRF